MALCGAGVSAVGSLPRLPLTCRTCAQAIAGPLFAFCENVGVSGSSPWHIRLLTRKGLCLGGGADTPTLCGRRADWDLTVPVTAESVKQACPACKRIWRAATR